MKKRYLSVQKWLDCYWANNPKWTPLFISGEHDWEKDHNIKIIKQIMFRLSNGWAYQPYGGFSDRTYWVYCQVTDHSKQKPKLKTKEELIQYQTSKTKFSKYNWSSEDLKMNRTDYLELSHITEEMLNKLLEDPKNLKKFNNILDPTINPESSKWWYNTMPHKEKPIKIYVAGGDDSSYTQLVTTVDEALTIIGEWKIKPPENPETDWISSYFTN